jgi:D-3-phosphoglycerate dehydrogenase
VAAYDPYAGDWPADVERYDDLGELAAAADFLSVHAPFTPETRHLIDSEILRRMPEHAILINTARGPLVDTDALDRALAAGEIGGAALDVLETEPPPPDLPLLRHDQLVITSHQAFYSEEALREQQRKAAENLRDALAGERPTYLVNAEVAS